MSDRVYAVPLLGSTNNDLSFALNNSQGDYNGCEIFFWQNGNWATYIANTNPVPPATATNGWVESNGPIMLLPGAGAVFYNPNSASVYFTLVGTVPTGSLTNTLNPGLNLVSSIIPANGDLSASTFLTFPNLSGGQFDGDQLFFYFNSSGGGYTLFTVDSLNYNPPANYGWDGLPGQPDPVTANPAQAFWYRAGNGSVQWTENFSFDDVASPDVAASPVLATRDAAGNAIPLKSRHFQFTLTGPAGKNHVLETSLDLEHWCPLGTNLWQSGKFNYAEPLPATNAMRFYRAFALP